MLSSRLTRPALRKPGQALKFLPAGIGGYDAAAGVLYGSFGEALTFTRATAATYADASGTVFSVISGKPRVAPGLGVLMELAATNIILQSQTFDNASWTPFGNVVAAPVVTANQATAPDGTLTADQIAYNVTTAVNAYCLLGQGFTGTVAPYTASVWLRTPSGTATVYLTFFLAAATYIKVACNVTTTWQRFQVTGTLTASGGWNLMLGVDHRDAGQTGQPAQTIYAWGMQVEQNGYATSYVPTTTAAVTRNADQLIKAVPAAWPVASGSVSFRFTPVWTVGPTGNAVAIGALQGSVQGFQLRILTTGALQLQMGDGTLTSTSSAALVWVPGQTYAIQFTWGAGNRNILRDGVSVASATGERMPSSLTVANIGIGDNFDGTTQVDGWISDLLVRAT